MYITSARTRLIALGLAAAVALPAAASAQSWRDNDGRRGGYDYNYSSFKGYPEFRDVREHLKTSSSGARPKAR